MALLDFGGNPIYVKSTGPAPSDQVLDVGLYFGSMTLLLKVLDITPSGGGTPNVVVKMETAMDPKADTWIGLGTFSAVSTSPAQEKITFTDLLRYVRWNVTFLDYTTSATFVLSGVARNP